MTRPTTYLVRMVLFLAVVGGAVFLLSAPLVAAFRGNPLLNALILSVLALGVFWNMRQAAMLGPEVTWVEACQRARTSLAVARPPRLLAPMASMLASRSESRRLTLSASVMRTILDGIAARLDESRELSRYMTGLLIFLGLLGTFWGLLRTVGSISDVIGGMSMSGSADVGATFEQLKAGLARPLAGMSTAFSASMFGLAGALVLGFLDLTAGQAQNRFYNELEEWLAGLTRLSSGAGAGRRRGPARLRAGAAGADGREHGVAAGRPVARRGLAVGARRRDPRHDRAARRSGGGADAALDRGAADAHAGRRRAAIRPQRGRAAPRAARADPHRRRRGADRDGGAVVPRLRRRGGAGNGLDAWPGYVDALSTFLIVIMFILMVFVLAQGLLSAALSGRTEALDQVRRQLSEMSRTLALERGESDQLRLRSAAAEARASAASQDAATERASVGDLSAQVAALRAQLAEMARALDLARTDAGDEKAAVDELTRKLNAAARVQGRGAAALPQRVLRPPARAARRPARRAGRRRPLRVPERGAVPAGLGRPDAGGRRPDAAARGDHQVGRGRDPGRARLDPAGGRATPTVSRCAAAPLRATGSCRPRARSRW